MLDGVGEKEVVEQLVVHALDAEGAGGGGTGLAALFAGNLGNVELDEAIPWHHARKVGADDLAAAVAVGEDNERGRRGEAPKQEAFLLTTEQPKAVGWDNAGVEDVGEAHFVVFSLHDDGVGDVQFFFVCHGILTLSAGEEEVGEHEQAEGDAVDAEGREAVLFDEVHEELDGDHGDGEGRDTADGEDAPLQRGDGETVPEKLDHLDQAGARHSGDGHKEGELGGGGAGEAEEHTADDGGAGARGAGDEGEHLEYAHQQGSLVADVAGIGDLGVVSRA